MNNKTVLFLAAGILAVTVLLAGCPTEDDTGAENQNRNRPNIEKTALNGKVVKNHLYIEVNNTDPRVAMGYVLEESRTPFFDHVVIFASNIKVNDRGEVYVYHNGNVQHIFANRTKYIKPLQDKGIKVLLGILGGWAGVGPGTLGEWPLGPSAEGRSDGYTWPDPPGYPYGPERRTQFLQTVKAEIDRLGLDGVDFDDEWCSKSFGVKGEDVYPTDVYYNNIAAITAAQKRGGKVYADMLIECREILGPDKIISVYEWRYAQHLPLTVEKNGRTYYMKDIIDYTTEAAYGSWMSNSYMGPEFPRAQFAPVGIDLGGDPESNVVRPSSGSIESNMKSHLGGEFGYNIFYNLLSKQQYAAQPSYFGAIDVEGYLSLVSDILYGEKVVYTGEDFPQDWEKNDD